MKKLLSIIICALLVCSAFVLPVSASGGIRLVDDADILWDEEEQELLSKLDEISARHGMDVVVVTTDSLDGKSAMEYADDYYDYNGYASDGILFLVCMGTRDWRMSTTGFAIRAFTDAGLEYIEDNVIGYLSDGDYYRAFDTYADLCDRLITQAENGEPFDVGNMPKAPFNLGKNLLISLIIGFVIALIVTLVMKSKLKSVHSQPAASHYVKDGSMNVTIHRDMFLYSHIDRRKRETSSSGGSSTHRSSSGSAHGGRGGKF